VAKVLSFGYRKFVNKSSKILVPRAILALTLITLSDIHAK